ncbi:MAG: glycosyltransferase [Tannerellaceae bacterium]|jgi:glycosyltransferase involved in cell wall biosynthesis|nr:glycosyltransferase [Tannerellaceae bacterium]
MKICFFAKVEKQALNIVGFYKQDIDILRDLGYEVKIATKWEQIDWSCDIIFIWWWTWAFVPVFISKIFRKQVIITGTFNFKCPEANSDYFRRPLIERILIRYSVKNAGKNIFVSLNEYKLVTAYWNLKNTTYSPHIVETNKYFPAMKSVQIKFIFTISWMQKSNMARKCLYEMIDAFELLSKENDVYYYIAGRKGDGYDSLTRYVNGKKLNGRIKILGEISESDKIALLQQCEIYFQISKYEGFGLAIAEAMACGAPVVVSDVGEVQNVVGDSGVIISGYDIEMIKNELNLLLNDCERKKQYSIKAIEIINNKFSYSRRYLDISNVIKNI